MAEILANKSREEIAEMAEKVIFPDTHRTQTTFLGQEVSLRPLPFKWVKMLNRAFAAAQKRFAEGSPDDAAADEETANAYLDATVELCLFYNIPKNRAELEAGATLPDMMTFCSEAAAICRDNDFLLWRLRGVSVSTTLAILKRRQEMESWKTVLFGPDATETIPNGSSSPASPKPTEDSTELSSDIPTGN